ncbi:MAG: kinase/pyrophosphorylase [Hyphomicrobiales bacterium]|nr:kinase/pyrophosphorylase [Hyphomicrobiales bacterium]
MNQSFFHLHLVSDGGEEGLHAAGQALAKLYPQVSIVEHIHPMVRTPDRFRELGAALEREPGMVLYRIADPAIANRVERKCRTLRCPSLSLLKLNSSAGAPEPQSAYGEMINLHLQRRPRAAFRVAATALAVILAIAAVWILSAEALRPRLASFPAAAAAVTATPIERDRAETAARVGLVRGDLWAEYAMTLVPQLPQEIIKGGTIGGHLAELSRKGAERAAGLSPHDSRIWLLLAAVASQLDRTGRESEGALGMSYYTGPNELSLIPLRLSIATRSSAIGDPDFQLLVAQEIRTVLTRKPDLKPWILVAYRNASPEGRSFLETTVGALDPALLATLRASSPAK